MAGWGGWVKGPFYILCGPRLTQFKKCFLFFQASKPDSAKQPQQSGSNLKKKKDEKSGKKDKSDKPDNPTIEGAAKPDNSSDPDDVKETPC